MVSKIALYEYLLTDYVNFVILLQLIAVRCAATESDALIQKKYVS
jgi:hypothetical protein